MLKVGIKLLRDYHMSAARILLSHANWPTSIFNVIKAHAKPTPAQPKVAQKAFNHRELNSG